MEHGFVVEFQFDSNWIGKKYWAINATYIWNLFIYVGICATVIESSVEFPKMPHVKNITSAKWKCAYKNYCDCSQSQTGLAFNVEIFLDKTTFA